MNRRVFVAAIGAVVLSGVLVGALFLTANRVPLYAPGAPIDAGTVLRYWKREVARDGGPEAYRKFGGAVRLLSDGEKHSYAHLFGEALFAVEGDAGFEDCDTKYQSGCLHQFLGSAVQESGMQALAEFARKCDTLDAKGTPGCGHGMGHITLSLTGYTENGLNRALDLCRRNFPGTWGGCADGVFMEYNIRDVSSGAIESRATARLLTDADVFTPCGTVPAMYRATCADELPHWWLLNTNPADQTNLARIGTRCAAMKGSLAASCAQGAGYVLSEMIIGTTTLYRTCKRVAGAHDNLLFPCLEGAARRHHMDYPEQGFLCDTFNLSQKHRAACTQYASFQHS